MLQLNFSPFPIIETERLLLTQITLDDAQSLFQLRSNEATMQYINRPKPKSVLTVINLIKKFDRGIQKNAAIVWGISLRDEPGLIGTISYHRIEPENYRAEIGYMLHPEHCMRGIMSEAIKAVIDFGFKQMNLHSIEANINPLNEASKRLLLKFGFIREAYFKENYYFEGEFSDSEVYSLINK